MDRLITVTGTGSVSVAPDYIEVYLNISGRKKDYAKAVDAANDKVLRLQEAIKSCGFDKEALKTTNFRVDVQYENVRDEKGAYHQQFVLLSVLQIPILCSGVHIWSPIRLDGGYIQHIRNRFPIRPW